MKIDWKQVSKSAGYRSLKAAYISDVTAYRSRGRSKATYLKHFNWVISRAKHYSAKTGRSLIEILDEWEAKRTYCWLNYYQDCNQRKIK